MNNSHELRRVRCSKRERERERERDREGGERETVWKSASCDNKV